MSNLPLRRAHERYLEQASWTLEARKKILSSFPIHPEARILDVGCGTGALAGEFAARNWYGLDIDFAAIQFAKSGAEGCRLAQADGGTMPFANGVFDLVYAHYFLLWQPDPGFMIREMVRVTKRGGMVAFFAEPDHDGRVDHPEINEEVGIAQTNSLREQGADTRAGRKLGRLLIEAGIRNARFGVFSGEWSVGSTISNLERDTLTDDLDRSGNGVGRNYFVGGNGAFIFIPTFYAYGTREV